MAKQTKAQASTEKLIAYFKGLPHEFDMLKGVLCVNHVLEIGTSERKHHDAIIDTMMIASRMDELTGAAKKAA